MLDALYSHRKTTIVITFLLCILASTLLFNLKFSFGFEQFFPQGDEDLEFFNDFISEFETDDNFLLIAIENKPDVFDIEFLKKVKQFADELEKDPFIISTLSLPQIEYPSFNPLQPGPKGILDLKDQEKLNTQKQKILNDERFLYNLIGEDGSSLVINAKIKDTINLEDSKVLMMNIYDSIDDYGFEASHYLGRAYFQMELSEMQKTEIILSSVVSITLVSIVFFLLFRRLKGILLAMISIGIGLLLFMGLLSFLGRELNVMSAFYPVLMLIVGTSDVVHIFTKYIDELKRGLSKKEAILLTINETGKATLLTSLTTAAGFLSLVTSSVVPIKDFGINSALGVMVAYITVIFFTTAVLSFFEKDELIKETKTSGFWDRFTLAWYEMTKKYPVRIAVSLGLFIVFCFVGIMQITTNYRIESNLPKKQKITADFKFFEEKYAGFRPYEFAIQCMNDFKADDYEVIQEVEKIEKKIKDDGNAKAIIGPTTIFKTLSQILSFDKRYALPETKEQHNAFKALARKIPGQAILFSEDNTKTRISARINDLGADSIQRYGLRLDNWLEKNIDKSVVNVRRTGTGLLLDKNSDYIRNNLLLGLGFALLIVSILMGLLFRNFKMLLISFVPNVVPLLFAAAILGWTGIELEAGTTIVFSIIFGIAVDDTIHFLSKYKISRSKGYDKEKSLELSFTETGKAIIFTSILLFFGFLVMLFSIHPPSNILGLLISITLLSALAADLFIIPLLIRKYL